MTEKTDESGTSLGTLRSLLILLFCSAWLLMLMTEWILPRICGRESVGAKTIEMIRSSTGTWQQWNMFGSIPILRSYKMEIISELSDGSTKSYGPVLPDLETFDVFSRSRYFYSCSRIWKGNPKFLDAYVAQATRALKAKDARVERFSIHIEAQCIRTLELRREDGKLWKTVTEEKGPFTVDHD